MGMEPCEVCDEIKKCGKFASLVVALLLVCMICFGFIGLRCYSDKHPKGTYFCRVAWR